MRVNWQEENMKMDATDSSETSVNFYHSTERHIQKTVPLNRYIQIYSKIFSILKTIKRDIIINVETSSRKVPVILVGFE
jgi:hypothetical protein